VIRVATLESSITIDHWLERHRAGDAAARNELLHHCRERLRLLTHQMLRHYPGVRQAEDTSDVVQNVLVRLDRALTAVEVPSSRDLLRLAAALIRRELIDLARHYAGRPLPDQDLEEGAALRPVDDKGDPLGLAIWTELHGRIAELPEAERELFELLYYQGLSQPAAAAVLGVPLTTFKRHWQAARLRLADELQDHLPE
jgi:RNA polymerase sigma-70 factor (ECF subfamily)